MTFYQDTLIREARDMWERGFRIPVDLFSKMTQAGLDVQALEFKFFKEVQHG